MKVGDKVYCNDGYREFTGWIASIDDSLPYPYSVVNDMEYIGKTFLELGDSVFEVFKLEDLTLLKDDHCQYCDLNKRELKMVQSELNDAYAMLQNRDKRIKELERELNIMKQSEILIKGGAMKYNKDILDRFLTEKIAINVETRQEWEDFMELLEEKTNCEWDEGGNPTGVENWDCSNEATAISFFDYFKDGLSYASCDFYQSIGWEVIKYKDLIKEKKQ